MSLQKFAFIAAILIAAVTTALAQSGTSPPAAPVTPAPAQGMPMIGQMQPMAVKDRIAFLETELKITDAQMPLWSAVAEAMRANAKDLVGIPNCMPMTQSVQCSGTLPEKLATREKVMTAHLEALRKLKAVVEPLYAALSDDQKKTADNLMFMIIGMM
jgi:hypothetical protein